MSSTTTHPSMFARALGSDFARLHPTLQERFGLTAAGDVSCLGRGRMDRMWRGRAYTVPFLHLGARRNVLFPETGRDVPFTIENYAYTDGFGRETVTFVRTFEVRPGRRRRFDATMVWNEERGCVVDYLGTHQHLAVDLELSVRPDGGLRIRSGAQRFHEGLVSVPLHRQLSGHAALEEWVDDTGRVHIDVRVRHPRLGHVYGYTGSFEHHRVSTPADREPSAVKPYREEQRA